MAEGRWLEEETYIPVKEIDFKTHVLFTKSQEIREICASLMAYFKLKDVGFLRTYKLLDKDKHLSFRLSTNPIVIVESWETLNGFRSFDYLPKAPKYTIFEHWVAEIKNRQAQKVFDKQLLFQREKYGYGTEFWVMREHSDYVDTMEFIAAVDDGLALNRFLTNIDLLEAFFTYFQNTTQSLMKKYAHHATLWELDTQERMSVSDNEESARKALLKQLNVSKETRLAIPLTSREMDCARLLLDGGTAKSIASELNISPRTVETHVINMKSKLGAYSKVQLVKSLRQVMGDKSYV